MRAVQVRLKMTKIQRARLMSTAPVFVLVGALVRVVVVEEGKVKARVEELVASRTQQPDGIIFTLMLSIT